MGVHGCTELRRTTDSVRLPLHALASQRLTVTSGFYSFTLLRMLENFKFSAVSCTTVLLHPLIHKNKTNKKLGRGFR